MLRVKDHVYARLYCVECGEHGLEDKEINNTSFLSALLNIHFDEENDPIISTVGFTCMICNTQISTRLISRYYYPPFNAEIIETEYKCYGSLSHIQANLASYHPIALNPQQKQDCEQYELAVREQRIDDAFNLLNTAKNIPARKIEAWLKVARYMDYSRLVPVLQKRQADYMPRYLELLAQAVEESKPVNNSKAWVKQTVAIAQRLVQTYPDLIPYHSSKVYSAILKGIYWPDK